MPMNNRLLRPLQTPGLLDLVPGAAAAYSLRSLSRSYADPVVTVRRSSDDAEEDFTAAEVADGTLAAFAGAGDAFVKQWWDQSGNARHATTAADANEPQIVDSGSVILDEGKPALLFDGTDDYLSELAMSLPQPMTFFIVGNRTSLSGKQNFFDGQTIRVLFEINPVSLVDGIYAGSSVLASSPPVVGHAQYAIVINGASSYARKNAAEYIPIGNAGAFSLGGLFIGRDVDASDHLSGTLQEFVIYQADLTSQRELIEGNIAWSYSV